jgi:hypothetical protein
MLCWNFKKVVNHFIENFVKVENVNPIKLCDLRVFFTAYQNHSIETNWATKLQNSHLQLWDFYISKIF